MIFWITMILIWPFFILFFPTKVIGRKNLVKGRAIWSCNHQSNWDIWVIGTRIFKRFYTLGKAELFKSKIVGAYLKGLGTIPVVRGKADIQAVKSCLRVLKDKNKPLIIFPTGTRTSSPDEVQNLKNGVSMFATKADATIVPIVLVRKPKFLRRNRMIIGEAINPKDYSSYEEINNQLTHQMEEMIEKYSYKPKRKKESK